MAFQGLNFLYGEQYSNQYDLHIMSINHNDVSKANAGSDIEIFDDSIFRNPVKIEYGSSQNQPLTFDMEVMSYKPINRLNKSKIEKWLFGRINPQKLRIVQDDLQNIYFNCYLTNPQGIYINNQCYGFSFTVQCDAPYAHEIEKTYTYRTNLNRIKFYNDTDNVDYTYPKLTIQMNDIQGGDISIINETDNNRTTTFTNLHANEIITIDNRLQTITSSEGRIISDFFNKKFFRLLSGLNILSIQGNVESIKIKYSNARKVGG